MVGILIAFEDFDPIKGIFKSDFVGLQNFKFFFSGSNWLTVTVNTLYLNVLFIVTGTFASILIAIVLSETNKKIFLKVSQTAMTLPNFVSWASIALFSVVFLSGDGIINQIITKMGGDAISFSTDPSVWRTTFVLIRLWKGAGWGAILYLAAITGISPEIYEAATMDGANKFQAIIYITIPLIKGTIILQLLLSIGNIFRGDFGMIYPFIGDNSLLFATTDVIDTYVYRAVRTQSNFSQTMAVGLYQSVMGFVMVILSNMMAKRYAPESAIF